MFDPCCDDMSWRRNWKMRGPFLQENRVRRSSHTSWAVVVNIMFLAISFETKFFSQEIISAIMVEKKKGWLGSQWDSLTMVVVSWIGLTMEARRIGKKKQEQGKEKKERQKLITCVVVIPYWIKVERKKPFLLW